MQTKELDSFRLSDAVKFHDKLNPKLWIGNKLHPKVKKQLELISNDFLEELGINNLDVVDITVSGSNAAYSYTKHSDLDLHILVNMKDLPQSDVYKELFNAKKTIYNDTHDIKIHGIPVELYIQDSNEPVISLGEYSIKNDKWIKLPTKRRANFDQSTTKLKYLKLLDFVKNALKTKNIDKLSKILKKIKQYRQAGLDKGGEFSPENLSYKALRSQGYITKLYGLRDKLHSETLTIENMYAQEDYHPNSKPRGPEFKPTMPKGTVRVDVSDVYDWYKLGQHVSNLKGLGKHDFGKGPPSTILSFGDEDTEHKYIKDLEKTGLSTTDIDPVDPNQLKGMKRQKVDPTYNVAETDNQSSAKTGIYQSEVFGAKAYHSKCLEKGCDWESRRFDRIKQAQDAAKKHSETHFKQSVAEAFDQPYKLKWEKSEHGDYDALTKLADGTYLSIMFNKEKGIEGEEVTQVEFHRNNSQEVTGEGDAQRIFATVLTAIQQYIKKYKPLKLFFSASKQVESGQNPESRASLYDRLVQRYARAWGYKAFRADNGDLVIYELSRINKVKEDETMQYASERTPAINPYGGLKDRQYRGSISEASGYIPSEKEKNDPRFKTALTVDVRSNTMKKDAKKFGNKISRAGIPPTINPNGKF